MTIFQISSIVKKELSQKNLSADELLRKALDLKTEGFTSGGKHFSEGTVFLAWYKNKALAALVKNGAIEVEGKFYSSLSAAAAHYTGRPTTNGWDFWYFREPGKSEFIQAKKAA
jgi:hypothetical protein